MLLFSGEPFAAELSFFDADRFLIRFVRAVSLHANTLWVVME